MRDRTRRALPCLVVAFALLALVSAPAARAALVYGLSSDNRLLSFDSATPVVGLIE
jgi:hypothetical protein